MYEVLPSTDSAVALGVRFSEKMLRIEREDGTTLQGKLHKHMVAFALEE